jgi:hypothetical protein
MSQNTPSATFDVEVIIRALDRLVLTSTGNHLSTLQETITRGVWSAATYEDIAQQSSWSEAHVKAVGAALWELLSEILQEPVSKKNFRATMQRRYVDLCVLEKAHDNVPTRSARISSSKVALEFPDGPVKLTSVFYCDRPPIEARCYDMITQPGALIRIRAPRQMGKTSLLHRILNQGKHLGYRTVLLNLQLVDREILQELDLFLQWFCARVTQELELPLRLTDHWDNIFGSKTSCKDYFENYLLPQCQEPLVLALDDVDTLFAYPSTADGFFALLRAWYEDAKNKPLWQTVRFILVHSTNVYIPLQINQSPFNVGMPIELPEFDAAQVQTLAMCYGLNWTLAEVEKLMHQIGGHPYLVQTALYHIAQSSVTLTHLLETATSTDSPFYPHLQNQLSFLEQHPDLVIALKAILEQSQAVSLKPPQIFQLTRMGLIKMQSGQLNIRCELYRQYLNQYS